MTPEEFSKFANQPYTFVPLVREVLADLDTPLSTYLKLANAPYSYLFESVHGGEKWGRYSIIGLPCTTRIKVFGKKIMIERDHESLSVIESEDPLAWIAEYQQQFKVAEVAGMPRFSGGLVGYFGYDTIRYIEPRLAGHENKDELDTPDILLMLSHEVVVFDNLRGKLFLITHVDPHLPNAYETGQQRLLQLENRLRESAPAYQHIKRSRMVNEEDFVSGFTEDGFKQAVSKAREYIKAGDIMQVVLSQRMSIAFNAPPLDLYRSLRSLNPSPYMFYLNLDDHYVVGSSPEILVRLEDGEITVRPIAGTRKRGRDAAEDVALEKDLLADPKEIAEHLMLIDLGRNDTGRVSKIGSVKVTDKMIVERYSHVMHIVSNVTGELKDGMSAMDVLRATFPAGTVSGAPKIRAMEIIDELEPVKRGIYSGAVGYLSWNGNMDTAIAIRTAVIKNNRLHIQAGAGIVYD
ncbi:MAG: anthranilate synthase component, partial [Pseudomonadota bacterium]|nr:anthranilate synthase component [Pseudomonadota bacterium]